MNTVVDLVDRLNDTSQSHHRCTVVEVMGRHAGHMALNTGIACGAVAIVTEETPLDINETVRGSSMPWSAASTISSLWYPRAWERRKKMARDIQNLTGIDTRSSILGHVQRGGSPSLRDRVMASQMGNYAVHLLKRWHRQPGSGHAGRKDRGFRYPGSPADEEGGWIWISIM